MARILLADDEPKLRDLFARYLTGLGHDVRTAADGNEVMAALAQAPADLLVTDINMPDMDGIEILTALRKNGSPMPVIAISGGGYLDKNLLLSSAAMLGALVTLEKPFTLEELRDAVDGILSGADRP
ncbi:MAG TPA: response regulator [Longimicrobiales bacterium]|nr:response regulator [Longimicrobiales bacterium]